MGLPKQREQTPEEIGAHAPKMVPATCRTCGGEFSQNSVAPTMSCPKCMAELCAAFWATMDK